jgi:hypothetical protein
MKTFMDYVRYHELASYDSEPKDNKEEKKDHISESSLKVAKEALQLIMDTRPEILIAFLNQYRNEPDIKKILNNYKLDSFQDIRRKMHGSFAEKGLGSIDGEKPIDDEEVHPNSADGYTTH